MDAASAASADSSSVLSLEDVERRGHARMTGEWGAAKGFRDGARDGQAWRPRDDHLHVGNDRRAQGGHADATATWCRTCARHRTRSTSRRTTSRCRFFRSATRFERMVSLRVPLLRRHDRLRRIVRHHRARPGSCSADGPDGRAARLREAPRAHRRDRADGWRPKAAIFRWAVNAGLARAKARAPRRFRGPGDVAEDGDRRPVRVLGDPRKARRPDSLRRIRQRAARRERDGVLSRDRHSHHRGLRPDRDLADPDVQSGERACALARLAARFPAWSCGSRTTARSWPAARTSCAATSTSLRRPPMC